MKSSSCVLVATLRLGSWSVSIYSRGVQSQAINILEIPNVQGVKRKGDMGALLVDKLFSASMRDNFL